MPVVLGAAYKTAIKELNKLAELCDTWKAELGI